MLSQLKNLTLFSLFLILTLQNCIASIKITFTGDLMTHSHIERLGKEYFNSCFGNVREIFQNDDLTVINLETAITDLKDYPIKKRFIFKMPPEFVSVLKENSVDAAGLANNHSMDYGEKGLFDTIKYLRKNKIGWFGAGKNIEKAAMPLMFRKNRQRIGITGFSQIGYHSKRASSDTAGFSNLAHYDISKIKEMKKNFDFLIVVIHFGRENEKKRNDLQKKTAYALIDAGADLIIGHHPHVLQEIEKYKGKFIFYSLGNFIFSSNVHNAEGMLVQLNLDNDLNASYKIYKLLADNFKVRFKVKTIKPEGLKFIGDITQTKKENYLKVK